MAILKNLIVNGASRFLQKAYFDDIEAGALTVSGTSTFNGLTLLKGTTGIYGSTPTLNFHFGNSSNVTSYIQETPSGTLNISNNFNVKGSTTVKGITASGTATLSQLVVNNTSNFGGKVKIDGDVDIIGNLRWSTIGEHMTIQNLGGTFLVAPTILQSTNIEITVNTITNNSVTFTISDASMITGTNVDTTNNTFVSGGANWRKLSLVKVSGKIGECVMGASDGTIDNINVSTGTMQITATVANASILEKRKYTASEISDFAVMLYKLHNGTSLFPIGIVLTSYGSDRKSYIDVYGGTSATPIARMGNLGGLTYKDYSDPDPTEDILANQWGFYTKDNAYFEGHIKTNAGLIGGWEITSEGLSKGTLGASSNSIYLVPNGKTTTNTIGGSAANLSWTITSNNKFGVTTGGAMYCSLGKIGGWTINGSYLGYGSIGSNSSAFLSPTGISLSNSIGGSTGTNTWCLTTSNTFGVTTGGALYSTSGKIGGWNITSTELSSGSFASSNADSVFLIPGGSATAANIGGYGSNVDGWVITSRNTFGVNKNGGMYCTSGKIGGWNISAAELSYIPDANKRIGDVGTTFLIPGGSDATNGKASIGGSGDNTSGWTITSGSTFGVTINGSMYCTAGKIAGWVIDTDSIRNGTKTSTSEGAITLSRTNFTRTLITHGSIQNLRFAVGNRFGINQYGVLYADSVFLSGDITATAGSIGNWKISDGQLSYTVNSTDTIGSSGSAFLIPGGSDTTNGKATIGGSDNIGGWTFTSGDNFGVTNTGAMYSTSGKIGGMTIDSGGIFTGTPRDATNGVNDTGLYLGNTGISRWIGGVYKNGVRTGGNVVNGLRLAIGENFAVNSSGYSWMSNVYAEKITAYRSYSIYGELPTTFTASDGYAPMGFEFVRAAAAGKSGKSFRDIGIGTNFLEEADTPWQNVKPEAGISITRDAVSDDDNIYSYVNIHGQFINFAGPNNGSTTVSQTAVTVQGSLTAINGRVNSGQGLYSALGVSGGAPSADLGIGWAATCVQSLSSNTEYNLTSNHCYLLTTWHATNNANRSMWLLRGGVAAYTKITMQDGSNNATSGANIVLTVTSSTVKVTSSNNASIAIRLIDLG